MTMEPSPFDPKWFSHKFVGPGLRYEVGVFYQVGIQSRSMDRFRMEDTRILPHQDGTETSFIEWRASAC